MVGLLIRLVISAFVLMFVDFILPGFNVGGFGGAFMAAIAIAILGYFANIMMGKKKSRQRRGIIGFVIAVIVIYAAQYFVQAMSVTAMAAVLIGVIDIFLPIALGR